MVRNKIVFLSALGKAFQIFKALCDAILARGGGDEDVARLEEMADEIAELVMRSRKPETQSVRAPRPRLLEPVGTVEVSGRDKFVTNSHFQKGRVNGVTISHLGHGFRANFLDKVEQSTLSTSLRFHRLTCDSVDGPIISELGKNYETSLYQIWNLLEQQPDGEPGVLLINGYSNIFYVSDSDVILWVVYARWYDNGWYINASPVGSPGGWEGGIRVFSR